MPNSENKRKDLTPVSEMQKKITARIAQEKAERDCKNDKKNSSHSLKKSNNSKELSFIQKYELPQSINEKIEQRMQSISDEEILGYFSENLLGDAKLFKYLHQDIVIFVRYWDRFLVWNGHHWKEDDYYNTYSLVDNICKLYLRLADSQRERLEENIKDKDIENAIRTRIDNIERKVKSIRSPKGQENILIMTQRMHAPMLVLPDDFDKKPYLLACPNGIVDLRTGDLSNGNPLDYLLQCCATAYDASLLKEENPCPETQAFLIRSMNGDEELVKFIWRLLGYGLIRERKDHIFTIFWGEHGRNGKDTLIKLITKTLGFDLSADIPVEMFLQSSITKNSSQASPDILDLRGRCFAWINEAEENQRFAMAKLKKLTGGAFISARGIHDKKSTTWTQTHIPILSTNELPRAKADDAAFWQRALIIKWVLSFVENPKESYERKADKYLDETLMAEAQGVLVRLVQGSMEYLQIGLAVPDQVREWTTNQRMKWDDIGQFLEECCILEEHCDDPSDYKLRIASSELHEYYMTWYARNKDGRDKGKISAKFFAQLLDKKNIPLIRSNGSKRLGIDLIEECKKDLSIVREARGIVKKVF